MTSAYFLKIILNLYRILSKMPYDERFRYVEDYALRALEGHASSDKILGNTRLEKSI